MVDIEDRGELVDTGGNFNMCNDISLLVNVQQITQFGISMAAAHDKSNPTCTHCGDFPIPMLDGSVFYTPMFYNPQASDCVLSPHAICPSSRGYLTKWTQEGSTSPLEGHVAFYNKSGDVVIRLKLMHHNGLFYTSTSAKAINHTIEDCTMIGDETFHNETEEGIEHYEEALLDVNDASSNINIDQPNNSPRRQQLEADLW